MIKQGIRKINILNVIKLVFRGKDLNCNQYVVINGLNFMLVQLIVNGKVMIIVMNSYSEVKNVVEIVGNVLIVLE